MYQRKEQQQNEKAKGFYVGGEGPYPGSVKFSNNYGWSNINNQKIDIKQYDDPVKSALYDENNGYEKYIQNLGLNVNIRLILKEEIESLRLKYSWISSSSYWTGSSDADYAYSVWFMYSNGSFYKNNYDISTNYGVRPVIESTE